MNSLAVEIPRACSVNCTDQELIVFLADGRNISVPIVWFPRLAKADAKQRADFEILVDFEIEFKKLEELNRRITDDPELAKQQLLKMRL